jgi:nicotinamidase-related amidase
MANALEIKERRVLDPAHSALLVIDLQEKFRPAIPDFDAVVGGSAKLVRAFRILGLPVLVTEQYPKGLGRTVPEIFDALISAAVNVEPPLEKTAFSACGSPMLLDRLRSMGTSTVLVCGIETHVCVNQSVHDLLAGGLGVHVALDAVGSRRTFDRDAALRKMECSGAVLTTVETAAFELLRDAKHPKFKEVQSLFK